MAAPASVRVQFLFLHSLACSYNFFSNVCCCTISNAIPIEGYQGKINYFQREMEMVQSRLGFIVRRTRECLELDGVSEAKGYFQIVILAIVRTFCEASAVGRVHAGYMNR